MLTMKYFQLWSLILNNIQRLNEIDLDSSEKFQNLLILIKEKYQEDFNMLSDNIGKEKEKGKGKGKTLDQNTNFKKKQTLNSSIIDIIADEMIYPISKEPANQLIEDNNIVYLSQNVIYKNLYSNLYEAGHIIPSIESENSDQVTNSDS